ncbi:hypothetical protein D3C74_476060 [compost metagenome]
MMTLYGSNKLYDLNQCWGSEEKLKALLRKGFLYDVEEILLVLNKNKSNSPRQTCTSVYSIDRGTQE